jgi:hypothetical protein
LPMPRSCWRSLRHRSKQRAWRSVRHARPERARSLTSRRRATQSPLTCSTWPLSSSPMLVKLRRSRAAGEGGRSTLEPRPARASCRRCCRGHDRTLRRRVSRRARGAPRLHAPAPRLSRSCAARCDAHFKAVASCRRSTITTELGGAGFGRRPYSTTRPWPPSSLSDLGLRCTHDADNTVWCSTKFHDAAATNTISLFVT